MGNIKDPISEKKNPQNQSKAPVKVIMQYKMYWANERSPQKISNSPDHPLVGRNGDKQVVLIV